MARSHDFFELTRSLALADFPAAMAALHPRAPERNDLLDVWAARDLAGAKAWLFAQPAEARSSGMTTLARLWAQVDGEGLRRFLRESAGDDDSGSRSAVQDSGVLAALAAGDAGATLSLLAAYPGERASASVLEMWAERDPVAAAARALDSPGAEKKHRAIVAVVAGWTRHDPAAARAWIDQLTEPAAVDSAWKTYAEEFARKDAAAALASLEDAPPHLREQLFTTIASAGASRDPEAMLGLARQQTDAKLRRALLDEALPFLSRSDPQRAAQIWQEESTSAEGALGRADQLVENLARGRGTAEALRFLDGLPASLDGVKKGAASGIARAFGWPVVAETALTFPPGEWRENWMSQALVKLVQDGDILAAQGLAARLPAGPEKDASTQTMAAALLRDEPDTAAQWLLGVADGRSRLVRETQSWLGKDRGSAARWIRSTAHFSADEKKLLLAPTLPAPTTP